MRSRVAYRMDLLSRPHSGMNVPSDAGNCCLPYHSTLERHRVLHGCPVTNPEKYNEIGNGHVLLVSPRHSIGTIQVLEHCEEGLVATIHFEQAMVAEDDTKLWSMTIFG